jgi:hypothetical protein
MISFAHKIFEFYNSYSFFRDLYVKTLRQTVIMPYCMLIKKIIIVIQDEGSVL